MMIMTMIKNEKIKIEKILFKLKKTRSKTECLDFENIACQCCCKFEWHFSNSPRLAFDIGVR